MQTVFDWITVAIFMAAAATFFHRAQRAWPPLSRYVAVAVGCMIANQLGNLGYVIPALLMICVLIGAVVWLGSRPNNARQ